MRARNLLLAQFGIIAILAGLHILAINYFLYWRLPWFDLLAHGLGGLWVALFTAWLLALGGKAPNVLISVFAVFVFATLWEIFEMQALIIDFSVDSLDTLKDIFMALIGGVIGILFARFLSA